MFGTELDILRLRCVQRRCMCPRAYVEEGAGIKTLTGEEMLRLSAIRKIKRLIRCLLFLSDYKN